MASIYESFNTESLNDRATHFKKNYSPWISSICTIYFIDKLHPVSKMWHASALNWHIFFVVGQKLN